MAEPVRCVTSGGRSFDFAGLMAHEMIEVTKWTGIERRRDFHDAIRDENPNAVLAAFTLLEWRESGEEKPPRWGSVRVDLDDLEAGLHVEGRAVEMLFEQDEDGRPLLVVMSEQGIPKKDGNGKYVTPTGADGEKLTVIPLTHDDGSIRYRYVDTGEEVPPTSGSTPGSTDSPPTESTSGNSSASRSPRPKAAKG